MTKTGNNAKGHILAVDDNPGNLKLLAKVLTENGFQVKASNSGRYALKSIKEYPPDLILLDVKMPEMDGYEVCRQLKANPLSANIPVIFISALKEEESKVMGFEVGGVDYITKPFQSQEILARVRTHLLLSYMQHHLEEMVHERTSEFQAERKRFQKLFELASDAFFVHDLDGTIIDVNRQACKSLGYNREELLHLKISDIETGVSQEQIIELCNRADKGEQVIIEGQHQRKDGSAFPVEISLGLFQEKEPKLLLAISRDISERKRMEEEISSEKEFTEMLINCSVDGILAYDRDCRYTVWSNGMENITGIRKEECLGKSAFDVFPFLKEIGEDKYFYATLEGQNVIAENRPFVIPNTNKKGVFEGYYSPLRNKSDEIVGGLAIIRDVTERKKAEEELRQYGHIVSCSTDMIAFLDRRFIYIAANQAYLAALNKSREDLIGHAASEVFGIEYFEKDIKVNAERCLAGKVVNYQAWFEFSACGQRYMDVTYSPYTDENNEVKGFVVNARNITEHKKMEEALLQSEKLMSLGTITAGIAHDFNNILAIISGKVQLLEMDYESNKELADELSTIMKAINDGVEISSRMLKFTKTEKDTTGFVSYDIRELIKQSLDFTMPRWKSMAQAKGIDYHIDKESIKEVPAVLCNPTELREVFINMINNALDAMPEGGSISFSTWGGDDTAFVSITDTGEGMPGDVKKRVFDPYFTTKGLEGTGLGMSMAYGIITRHGGKIEVESKVEKGSTFKLQFPITTKTVCSTVTPVPEQETENKSLRILVVDDEEAICHILDKVLSRYGHRVRTIDNGADAIELAKRESFDLVLCDLAMPEVYGYDVIEVLNRLEKRPKIGIITGWGEKLKPLEENLKVDFIVKKPFNFSVLKRHIKETFEV